MNNQRGYIKLVLIVFAVIMGLLLFPMKYPVKQETANNTAPSKSTKTEKTAFCSIPTASEKLTFKAPQDQNTKCPNGPNGSYKSGGVSDTNLFKGGNTTYELIRKNVPLNTGFFDTSGPHSTLAADVGITPSELDPNKYRLFFPEISGEIKLDQDNIYSRTRDCGDRSYLTQHQMYFIDYGLAFAEVLDQNGQPIMVHGTTTTGDPDNFYLVDVYKDVERDNPPAEAFQCDGSTSSMTTTSGVSVNVPDQEVSLDKRQLQLQYFTFGQGGTTGGGSVVNGWHDTCKPAIYLYPPEKELVNVKVYPEGFLKYVDPPYNSDTGWTVEAAPNGDLYEILKGINTQKYTYLYYESKIRDEVIQKPTKGWVVKFDELNNLYKNILPKLGLNKTQEKDFIDYWNKALPESPYYFVGVVGQQNVDEMEKLEITPKPDSINRVRIYFERLDSPKTVSAPNLESKPFKIDSTKFTVVEWGGMVKNDPNHPFTCSQ